MTILQDAKLIYTFMSEGPSLPSADFLLVLGSHDIRVAEHAASLYSSHTAPLVICTGGYGKMTEGCFAKPEGIIFAERCVACGVPMDAILIESKATNTGENFILSKKCFSTLLNARKEPLELLSLCANPIWQKGPSQQHENNGQNLSGA